MIDLRERAKDWDVDPDPLIQAVESAMKGRRYRERQKPLIASAEPAKCTRQLGQAYKAIAALPLRARAHLHWELAERITYGRGLDPEQVRRLMQDTNLVDMVLDALSEPIDPEEPDRELQWLVQAWKRAGGEVQVDDRYDEDLIEFLTITYQHLGETLTHDAIRRRLDRIRRDPLDSDG
ncbi:hypothetical protein [Pseudomonas sp. Irchel 3A7]|uniref:hypothetical protein n=1 Tax=Pseudomonas sp. Irchel 3A7 TaxID=2008913 RepID=UPI000BA4DA43|nr:hypothetical protein [Pseudomonas sp. Irchel 3A7]